MASLSYHVKTKRNPSQIYVRFIHGRKIDAWASTNFLIDPKFWDKGKQRLRNTKHTPNAIVINAKLDAMKGAIIDKFIISYTEAKDIDSAWLRIAVLEHFGRPAHEISLEIDKTAIFFADFINWWLDNIAGDYRNEKSRRRLTDKRKGFLAQYEDKIKSYETHIKKRIKISDLTTDTADSIMSFLDVDLGYATSVINKLIVTHNFFCLRAIEQDRAVPRNYKCLYQPEENKDVPEPYLNEDEIAKIFNYDFSDNDRLDNARDNFIIGLHTGLRVGDFLNRLRIDNISEGYIEVKTAKTNSLVSLPIHWMVKATLNKRIGLLPRKISDVNFNLYIKEVCEAVNIDEEIEGHLFDAETKRNKLGLYAKHKLVSSHICRRSFATNNFDRISNDDLMRLCGWSNLNMMFLYIKKTSRDSARRLQESWEKDRVKKEQKNN